ncbi:MAG: fumarylacetoacetate hydrolase family protein [Lentisphaeria bacterium]|jgi:2-keto-4-pentenoate hydratase/2-oxohepta-3-ene-1,7-dioic acid hydratase in catechol pathway|nr:fumarylacetoacetate hydrolase family protein [Lentisphaeria bacterium]
MKLIRFGEFRQEKPGILLDSGARKDLSDAFSDWDSDFFDNDGLAKLADIVASRGDELPDAPADARLGSCVARPYKVICIGLNYEEHARESGLEIPPEPIVFFKATNTVVGPYDNVTIPRNGEKTDWEVELGVIIGKAASYLASGEAAADHIAGYCISHDVSERAFQLERGGQWVKGKSCDTFNPLGPFMATPDELADPMNLAMSLDVNGVRKQSGNTSTMIFDVCELIRYLSQFFTLEPGDVLTTGTPSGVGLGMNPPEFLSVGDVVELAVEGLGSQRQTCVAAE